MRRSHVVVVIALCCLLAGSSPGARAQRAASGPSQQRARCGAIDLTDLEQELVESQAAAAERTMGAAALAAADRKRTGIPVHFHIITTAGGAGDVSALVPAQMNVLNAAYKPRGFKFRLASVQVIPSDTWFFATLGSAEEIAMKDALRVGGPDDLNIYSTSGDVYLGWATFPHDVKRFPRYDGVVLYWASFPGTGFEVPFDPAQEPDGLLTYDEGDTATHEVGHWLGLFHTFQRGCSKVGDRIQDTPAEAEPQFFCKLRDSCTGPKFDGLDPVTNFMDYVDDACMTEFTSDQGSRMERQWRAFRQ